MGEHKTNPRALEKAMRPSFPPGMEIVGFRLDTTIEFNRETMDEVTRAADAATLNGEDPRRALHLASQQWNPKDNPERFDVVVWNVLTLGRPSPILPDPRQIPTAMVRVGEHARMPFAMLRARADEAFKAMNAAGRSALQ
jgi:hypothetical protein